MLNATSILSTLVARLPLRDRFVGFCSAFPNRSVFFCGFLLFSPELSSFDSFVQSVSVFNNINWMWEKPSPKTLITFVDLYEFNNYWLWRGRFLCTTLFLTFWLTASDVGIISESSSSVSCHTNCGWYEEIAFYVWSR